MDLSEVGSFVFPLPRSGHVTGAEDLEKEAPSISVSSGGQIQEGQLLETTIHKWVGKEYEQTPLTRAHSLVVERGFLLVNTLRPHRGTQQDDLWIVLTGAPPTEPTGITDRVLAENVTGFDVIVRRIRELRGLFGAQAIADRVAALAQLTDEELEGDRRLNLDSLLYFVGFLERERALRVPVITLTPDGDVYSSWRVGSKLFSIQFFSDGRASYVCFAPNPGNPSLTDRRYVQTTSDQLSHELTKTYARGWLRAKST